MYEWRRQSDGIPQDSGLGGGCTADRQGSRGVESIDEKVSNGPSGLSRPEKDVKTGVN